jgi:hypothetical protein
MRTSKDAAIILQLVPYPGMWEFQYLFCNYPDGDFKKEGVIGIERVPMLGLALVDFPFANGYERIIAHFGNEHQDPSDFALYTERGWRSAHYIHPCFMNDPQTRALGIAPKGSGDDYFDEDVTRAKAQLGAERTFTNKFRKIHKIYEAIKKNCNYAPIWEFSEGLDNLFAIHTGRYHDQAEMSEWTKVFSVLDDVLSREGDEAMVQMITDAANLPYSEVEGVRFEKMCATETL